jgi:hypothetical protein
LPPEAAQRLQQEPDMNEIKHEVKRVLHNGWFWTGMLLTLLVRATWFS